jgi:ATP/maltotriose-dependent transcriptional regulator MalT
MPDKLLIIEVLERELQKHTDSFKALLERNQEVEQELERYRLKTDELRQELLVANKALLSLVKQTERGREDIELQMASAIRVRVMPILRRLMSDPALSRHRTEVELLQEHLIQICPPPQENTCWTTALSNTELHIATLVRHGYSSAEIAQHLHISIDTVKTHRKSIRRKLNLHRSPSNLRTHLQNKGNHVSQTPPPQDTKLADIKAKTTAATPPLSSPPLKGH